MRFFFFLFSLLPLIGLGWWGNGFHEVNSNGEQISDCEAHQGWHTYTQTHTPVLQNQVTNESKVLDLFAANWDQWIHSGTCLCAAYKEARTHLVCDCVVVFVILCVLMCVCPSVWGHANDILHWIKHAKCFGKDSLSLHSLQIGLLFIPTGSRRRVLNFNRPRTISPINKLMDRLNLNMLNKLS